MALLHHGCCTHSVFHYINVNRNYDTHHVSQTTAGLMTSTLDSQRDKLLPSSLPQRIIPFTNNIKVNYNPRSQGNRARACKTRLRCGLIPNVALKLLEFMLGPSTVVIFMALQFALPLCTM